MSLLRPKHSELDILLLEDSARDAELIVRSIEDNSAKASIAVVGSVQEAMHYLEKEGGYEHVSKPNLIMLDLTLPKESGIGFLDFVKTDDRFRTIPVIVLTSMQADSAVRDSYAKYANCFFNKPDNLSDLTSMVNSITNFWSSVAILPKQE
ncbi:response regulator [Roseivirga sp. UBA1976]|uniref:response regulator n=1 Tax=Roseivirga sp. UBA1976 TaxID=1947386 RepID=UPI00257E86F0|nr:response regulator [Roseivirga sp. UBA1976]|tara:strand:+ start:1306 stop:1758 length:453 start_codon:yes stop_codon:yes gene_type:complete